MKAGKDWVERCTAGVRPESSANRGRLRMGIDATCHAVERLL